MNRSHLIIPFISLLYFIVYVRIFRKQVAKKVTFNILDVGKALDLMDFVFIT